MNNGSVTLRNLYADNISEPNLMKKILNNLNRHQPPRHRWLASAPQQNIHNNTGGCPLFKTTSTVAGNRRGDRSESGGATSIVHYNPTQREFDWNVRPVRKSNFSTFKNQKPIAPKPNGTPAPRDGAWRCQRRGSTTQRTGKRIGNDAAARAHFTTMESLQIE